MNNQYELMQKDGRVKVAYCLCGEKIVMGSRMPMAETDKESIKDFAKYAKEGRKIDYVKLGDCPSFCTEKDCPNLKELKNKEQLDIFNKP